MSNNLLANKLNSTRHASAFNPVAESHSLAKFGRPAANGREAFAARSRGRIATAIEAYAKPLEDHVDASTLMRTISHVRTSAAVMRGDVHRDPDFFLNRAVYAEKRRELIVLERPGSLNCARSPRPAVALPHKMGEGRSAMKAAAGSQRGRDGRILLTCRRRTTSYGYGLVFRSDTDRVRRAGRLRRGLSVSG